MQVPALTGSRLRERRLALGRRQGEVAAAVGISASYLNLIEHNRRAIAVGLLDRLAAVLQVPVAELRAGAAAAVLEEMRAAALRVGAGLPDLDRAAEFAGRYPGWAAVVARLETQAAGMTRALEVLHDRMSHDPHLSASLHEVLSAASSVQAAAGILAETEDIEPEWRLRFQQNLHHDSARLALGAQALADYLEGVGRAHEQGIAAPSEEVEAWLAAHDWQVAEARPDEMVSGAAQGLGRALAAQAASDARLLPAAPFARARAEVGTDPWRLAAMFSVEVLVVMRRLALDPGPGSGSGSGLGPGPGLGSGAEMGLVLCDASGTLTFKKPVAGFPLPRFGSACPLWPLFAALGRPMVPLDMVVETLGPAGARFRVMAFAQPRFPEGPHGPELREAAMLIMPLAGVAGAGVPGMAVGSSCRICLRAICPARREPSILTI